MPRILITTDRQDGAQPRVLLEERLLPEHIESPHHSAQLIERVAWAMADAEPEGGRASDPPDPPATR